MKHGLACVVVLAAVLVASAGEVAPGSPGGRPGFARFGAGRANGGKAALASRCQGGSRTCWYPDDYAAKPLPCVRLPATCGGSNDYCPKPMPCVRVPVQCGFCDDYCPKPAPVIRCP